MDARTLLRRRTCLRGLVRTLREERRLTQNELALRLGVSQSFVSKYETGELLLDVAELHALAEALELPLKELIAKYLDAFSDR